MTRNFVIAVLVVYVTATGVSLETAGASPVIATVDSLYADTGATISVTGTGLSTTNRVLFHMLPTGVRSDASFNVVDDGLIEAIVPFRHDVPYFPLWVLSVFGGDGTAVGIPPNFISVVGTSNGGGASVHLVEDGGVLTGGFGSSVVYIRSGGIYASSGGGSNLIFVEDGGTYLGTNGGGSNDIFYEPFANIEFDSGGGGNRFTEVPNLSFTVLSTIPIPPAVWLFGSALGLMGVMRRKITS